MPAPVPPDRSRLLGQNKSSEKGGILIHSNASPTKRSRAPGLMSGTKNGQLSGANAPNF
jgi:hypothetical protein